MEKETEEVIDIESGKEKEVAESLKIALQKERDEKKALKDRIAELEKAKAEEPAKVEEPVKPQAPDVATIVKETVREESLKAEVERNIVALAKNDEERAQMLAFISSYNGDKSDATRLARMAKAAVNADSFIGDVGGMADAAALLSSRGGQPSRLTQVDEIEITDQQFMHMRALGYKDRESMKKAIKAYEEYNSRK